MAPLKLALFAVECTRNYLSHAFVFVSLRTGESVCSSESGDFFRVEVVFKGIDHA
ncbi:MAG: hypothetical protein ACI9R3_005677 [Verrucomicrobiales bacterium]|jgi:hypothetical protein